MDLLMLTFFPALDEDNWGIAQRWPYGEEFFEDNREYWPTAYLMYVAA